LCYNLNNLVATTNFNLYEYFDQYIFMNKILLIM
jgi:hypothetical protein